MVTTNSSLDEKYFDNIRKTYPLTFISDERIHSLLIACSNEDQIKVIFSYLSQIFKSTPDVKENGDFLFRNIDESHYDLTQWIEAIYHFHLWLESQQRKSTLRKMVGYINCCNDSPENKTLKYRLKDILQNMIDEYGYVG